MALTTGLNVSGEYPTWSSIGGVGAGGSSSSSIVIAVLARSGACTGTMVTAIILVDGTTLSGGRGPLGLHGLPRQIVGFGDARLREPSGVFALELVIRNQRSRSPPPGSSGGGGHNGDCVVVVVRMVYGPYVESGGRSSSGGLGM